MRESDSNSGGGFSTAPAMAGPLLETLLRHAPIGIALLDLDFRIVLINDTLTAINGSLWASLEPHLRNVIATVEPITDVEVAGTWLEGFYPVCASDGRITGIAVIAVELTEPRRAEAEYRAIVAAMPDFVFELGADGMHHSFHAPLEEQLYVRADLIVGRRVRDMLPAAVADIYEAVIARTLGTALVQRFEYTLDYPEGSRHFEGRMVRKAPDKVLVVVRNITDRITAERDRQRLEEQFRQSQKMEAMGQLAGGVAHDFNNLLTIITGYSDMALDGLPADSPVRDAIVEVQKAGERAGALTRQLLLFSRQQILEPRVLDLNAVVGNLHKMLARVISEDVALHMDLSAELGAIRVDPGQIEQVLLNLAVNARDAMPGGGRLSIATSSTADYVTLTVRDTGIGMDDQTRAHIFEPFFTTKEPGKGTGLGLAVVFGVVRQSGGSIDVTTAPGEGTTFALRFPRVDEAIAEAPAVASRDGMPGGDEVLLLVEDDDSVRRMARRILEGCGYTILEAGNGQEAITLLETHQGPIDLLVSDVVMPHLGGRQVAEAAILMKPGIKVLFLSGYTDDAVVRHGIQVEELAFLQKPFTPGALASKVRAVLDQERS